MKAYGTKGHAFAGEEKDKVSTRLNKKRARRVAKVEVRQEVIKMQDIVIAGFTFTLNNYPV